MVCDSDFVFEEGDPVPVGAGGETALAFVEGKPVLDGGASDFLFEQGRGVGLTVIDDPLWADQAWTVSDFDSWRASTKDNYEL